MVYYQPLSCCAMQIHQRDLTDNLELRKRQVEIEDIHEKIKLEEQRLGGLDVNNLSKERNQLEKEYKSLVAEVNE